MPSSQPISSAEIIGDKDCIYCGQSLRGISSQDKCPNCGKPAGYSLLGDHLRDAESTWTKAVVRGIDIGMGAFGLLALVRVAELVRLLDPAETVFESRLYRYFLAVLGWLAMVVAVGLMTQKETSGSMLARRRGVATSLLISTLIYTAYACVPKRIIDQINQPYAKETLMAVAGFCLIVNQLTLWILLRRVIDRTPRREVGRRLRIMFWITLLLFILANDGTFMVLNRLEWPGKTVLIVTIALTAAVILHRLGAIYLLLMTRKAIRRTVGYWDI